MDTGVTSSMPMKAAFCCKGMVSSFLESDEKNGLVKRSPFLTGFCVAVGMEVEVVTGSALIKKG